MNLAFLLAVVGLLMLFLEFYLPSGIMGGGAALLLILSIVQAAQAASAGWIVAAFVVAVIMAVWGVVRFNLNRIRSSAAKGTFYLPTDQEGYVASSFDQQLVGQQGIAATDLRPSGHVRIQGAQLQAQSSGEYITKGSPIVVTGGQGATLIVKSLNKDETA